MQKVRPTQGSDHFDHTPKTQHMVRSHVVRMQHWSGETDDNLTFTRNTKPYLSIMKKQS